MEQNTQSNENNSQIGTNANSGQIFNKPEKKNNKKVVLLAVIVVVVVLGVAASYFLFFSDKKDDNTPVLENEKVEEVKIDKELDSDQDGLPDYIEKILGTDINNSDTDGDGYSDFEEIKNGYDPLGDKKYTEEEWEAVKEEIRGEGEESYKSIFVEEGIDNNEKVEQEQEQDNFVCGTTTVKDIDGNIYNTVSIGNQCWLKENLKVTKNPVGETITRYCYDNDPKNCDTDGGLYDWNTAMNSSAMEGAQGICPESWHIPKDSEWYVLESGLATSSCLSDRVGAGCYPAGTKLQKSGSSKFEAIFAGFRYAQGPFERRGEYTDFWSSTEKGILAWSRFLSLSDTMIYRATDDKRKKHSVRCLKD